MPVKITKLASYYHRLCTFAGLETDMVKRILLSIIPHLTSPSENAFYQGFPDYKALKQAVQGVTNLIKFGTKACVEELEYYGDGFLDEAKYEAALEHVSKGKALLDSGNIKECLQFCYDSFKDADYWISEYGGEKWAKIAKVLLGIYKLRDRMENVRQALAIEKDMTKTKALYEQELSIMKEIIVDMNVFDGLAHNSGSIFDKMIVLEDEELGQPKEITEQNKTRLKKIMDSKELTNPIDVYKAIEEPLRNSGESYPFKDVMQKAQRHPDYYTYSKRQDQINKEYETIHLRKEMIMGAEGIKSAIEDINRNKNKVAQQLEDGKIGDENLDDLKVSLLRLEAKLRVMEGLITKNPKATQEMMDQGKKYILKIDGWLKKCREAIRNRDLFDFNNYVRYVETECDHLCDLAKSV